MWKFGVIFFFFSSPLGIAQQITGIGTVWANDLREWVLLSEEDEIGELRMRWRNQNDWTNWDYRIGEITGTIEQKWRDDPNEWEIRGDNEIATARTIWKNKFREWRITNNDLQLTIRTRYGNIADEWETITSDYGYFEMLTVWEGDPREWVIIDELDQNIPLSMRMALIFVVMYNSTGPK